MLTFKFIYEFEGNVYNGQCIVLTPKKQFELQVDERHSRMTNDFIVTWDEMGQEYEFPIVMAHFELNYAVGKGFRNELENFPHLKPDIRKKDNFAGN